MSIKYQTTLDSIDTTKLEGFFVGWPNRPSAGDLFKTLKGSSHMVLAIDFNQDKVIGFINAISDGYLSAFIPMLEVLPEYQKQGIGKQLVEVMMDQLKTYRCIDLCCDTQMQSFYEKHNMTPVIGIVKRMPQFPLRTNHD